MLGSGNPLATSRLGTRIPRASEPVLTSLLNSYKLAAGKLIGLRDDRLVGRKTLLESKIRNAVERDPKLGTEAGKVWDEMSKAYKEWASLEKPYQVLESPAAIGSNLFRIARQIVRGEPVEREVAINDSLEVAMLSAYLKELKQLSDKEAPIKSILAGKSTTDAAADLVKSTRLKDPAQRTRGADDPMLRLAQTLGEPARKLRKKHQDLIESLEASAAGKIAGYRRRLFGAAEYPDATATPRVEFGVVKGYTDRAGVPMPYASTFGGPYYRKNNDGPYQVPQRWVDLKPALNLVATLDFVSTCDIGGGDAGAAVVNRAGELVGLTFDGNLESLPGVYLYRDEQARAIHVSVEGIAEALAKIYKAGNLLRELGIGTSESAGTSSRPKKSA